MTRFEDNMETWKKVAIAGAVGLGGYLIYRWTRKEKKTNSKPRVLRAKYLAVPPEKQVCIVQKEDIPEPEKQALKAELEKDKAAMNPEEKELWDRALKEAVVTLDDEWYYFYVVKNLKRLWKWSSWWKWAASFLLKRGRV